MTDRLLEPPPFLLAEQYASALTTLGLALCWMPVLPISPYLACLGAWLQTCRRLRLNVHRHGGRPWMLPTEQAAVSCQP